MVRDGEGLHAATRTALAFHDPKGLEAEQRAFLKRARLEMPADQAMEEAERMLVDLRRTMGKAKRRKA